ncbi:MAG: DUF6090 family protein [Cyclobacteriaceae bacterium]
MKRYLFYAVGEIFLVVIGILIAIQVNNLNNRRHERKQAAQIYKQVGDQIREDQAELSKVAGINSYFSSTYESIIKALAINDQSNLDSLAYLVMGLSQYSDFRRSSNIYETLVNSGDIKLLKNIEVTNGLQKLEMTYNHINQLENIHWEVIINELSPVLRGVINYSTLKVVEPDQLFSVEMQNIVIESLFLTKAKDSVYRTALSDIGVLLDALNSEIPNPSD